MISTSARPDFADWLSPMLVKELRQGIRSRVFASAFYLTQVLMIITVIFNLTATTDGDATNRAAVTLNVLFWFMIAVPLVFFMPIRGFGALHGEIKSGTMELVFLTRLSALRIAAGKWAALMVQTLLVVAAVLPYVLLRYFLGGVNVVQDLQSLGILLVASGMLTATTLAISPYESRLLRALFSVGMVFGFLFAMVALVSLTVRDALTGGSGTLAPWIFYAAIVLFVPAYIYLGLEIAAARIAPAAENHAIRKRCVAFYLLGAAALLGWLSDLPEPFLAFAFLLLTIVVIDALAEPLVFVRSIYRPFQRWGGLGRFCGLVFTPGWVSAAWFVALLAAAAGGVLAAFGLLDDPNEALTHLTYLGWLIFPAALLRLVVPDTKHFLGLYLGLQFFFAALAFLVGMMSSITDEPLTIWLCPLPSSAFWLAIFDNVRSEQSGEFLLASGIMTAASLGILLARSFTPLGAIRAKLRQPAHD